MNSQPIVELVNQWAAYEQSDSNPSLRSFCLWYLSNQSSDLPNQDDVFDEIPLNGLLGKLLGRVSQYDHLYTKKALAELGLTNVDDMMYMHMIHHLKSPKKSDLISHMLSEFPSGIEIIRRLLRHAYIEELPDLTDKRSKRVKLTPTGESVLLASYSLLHRAGRLMFEVLTEAERLLLAHLLGRLDDFHSTHHKSARTAKFDAVYNQLMTELGLLPESPSEE